MRYEYRFYTHDLLLGSWLSPTVTAGRIDHDPQTIIGAGEVCAIVARRHGIDTAPSSTATSNDEAKFTWYAADQKIEIESRRIDA